MYYEINVAKNGRHYFATAERSLTDERSAKALWADIKQRFPESEGFNLSVSYRQHVGEYVTAQFNQETEA